MFVFVFPKVWQQFKTIVLPESTPAGRTRGWGNVPKKNRVGQIRRPTWQKSCRIPIRANLQPGIC